MKRSRGHASRGRKVCGQPQVAGTGNSQRVTIDDALTYLKAVKEMFQDNMETYQEFLQVMKDFKAQRLDTVGVITRVKELFKGHQDLLVGFNKFLPKEYEIALPLELELQKPREIELGVDFVNKVKARFVGDDHAYESSFLNVLNMYIRENKPSTEVFQEIAVLFQDHPEILMEFTYFFPEAASTNNIQSDGNCILGDGDSIIPSMEQMHIDKKVKVAKEQCFSSEQEQKEDRDMRRQRPDDQSIECDGLVEPNMQEFRHKRDVAEESDAAEHLNEAGETKKNSVKQNFKHLLHKFKKLFL